MAVMLHKDRQTDVAEEKRTKQNWLKINMVEIVSEYPKKAPQL